MEVEKEKKRVYYRAYYAAHRDEYREYQRRYCESHKDGRSATSKKWREENPNYDREYFKTEEHRLKRNVRNKVNYAIRCGKLTKQPCEVCGAAKVEAHHCDYNKPLDVMWLCKKCHGDWHVKNTPIY